MDDGHGGGGCPAAFEQHAPPQVLQLRVGKVLAAHQSLVFLLDAEARVLNEGGDAIPGLYAAGADAGGVYVRAYAGGLAAALVFGLRAAKTALEAARAEVA